jgi:hypothetical protein
MGKPGRRLVWREGTTRAWPQVSSAWKLKGTASRAASCGREKGWRVGRNKGSLSRTWHSLCCEYIGFHFEQDMCCWRALIRLVP